MGRRALLDPVSAKLLLLLMLLPLSCGQQNDATTTPIVVDGPRYSSVHCIDELLDCQAVKGIEDILEDFTHYNKMERPTNQGEPTVVNISMTVKNIASIDVTNMDYKMTIFLVRQWRDSRLKLRKEAQIREDHIDMPDDVVSLLWRPSVFFDNEKDSVVHSVTAPNSMLKIYNDSRVLLSMRITLTLSCPMDIKDYPWDSQICPLAITSASYTANEMLLQWDNKERSIIHKNIKNLQFELDNIILSDNCTTSEIMGNFSCLHADFKLHRTISSSENQMLISSFLISFLSCFTFLIPIDKAPARISIGVATTISMATQCASAHANMPKVPYMTSMEFWLNLCFGFIIIIFILSILQIFFCGIKNMLPQREGQGTSSQPASASILDPGDDRPTSTGRAPLEQREQAGNPGPGENNEGTPLLQSQRQLERREQAGNPGPGENNEQDQLDCNPGMKLCCCRMIKCISNFCIKKEIYISICSFSIFLALIIAIFGVQMNCHKCLHALFYKD